MSSDYADPDTYFRLRAYICDDGYVKWISMEGWVQFWHIYINRPESCRFAVAGTSEGAALSWDLFDAMENRYGYILAPVPLVFPTVEAAVMATVLRPK